MVGNQGKNVRNENELRLINFCVYSVHIENYKHVSLTWEVYIEVKSRNERSTINYLLLNKRSRRDAKYVQ